jgi:tetratricopeptide (TPR) repeat protein
MRTGQVFVSHTSDMDEFPERRSFVQAALDAVSRAGMASVDMRYFAARDGKPADYCRQRVRECEIYVAVIGFRYGSMVPGGAVSYTELEFDEAGAAALPRLVFLLDEPAGMPATLVDADRDAAEGFRQRLRSAGLVVRAFTSPAALELEVFHALTEVSVPPALQGTALAAPAGNVVPGPLPRGIAAATHTLPRDITSFTGRNAELEQVLRALQDRATDGGVVQVSAVDGMAGIGKTAFAVHVAHRLSPLYPDGQIFLRLHGHTPGQRPVRPAEALATLLLTTGITPRHIPAGLDARQQLWRAKMAGRKVLLVLDDATGSDQVRPLLPGTAESLVIVTSRRRLIALSEALPVTLETLTARDAARLFTRLAGRPGLDVGSDDVARTVALCGYLPLAVSLMAGQLKHHPMWTTGDLADDIASARNRLAAITAEDISVQAAFDTSYHDLRPAQQELFRRIGLHPGSDIDAYAAAALADTDPPAARGGLDDLYSHHLIDEPTRGRYRFHDLIRDHARVLAEEDEPAQRAAATARLLDFYRHASATAEWSRAERGGAPPAAPLGMAASSIPDLSTPDLADAWVSAERLNLHAAIEHAAANESYGAAADIAWAVHRFLIMRGHWGQARDLSFLGLASARQAGDRNREARLLLHVGEMEWIAGNSLSANQVYTEALRLYRELGDRHGEARSLSNLVGLGPDHTVRNYEKIAADERNVLAIYEQLGDKEAQAETLLSLSSTYRTLGDYQESISCGQRAYQLYNESGKPSGEAAALNSIGRTRVMITGHDEAHLAGRMRDMQRYRDRGFKGAEAWVLNDIGTLQHLAGNYQAAIASCRESLRLSRELGNRHAEDAALNNLGASLHASGAYEAARDCIEQALRMLHDRYDHDDKLEKARALNNLGELLLESAKPAEAIRYHRQALIAARDLSAPYEQARAHEGIGRCHLRDGQPETAQKALRRALGIYQRIGAFRAVRIQHTLAGLPGAPQTAP